MATNGEDDWESADQSNTETEQETLEVESTEAEVVEDNGVENSNPHLAQGVEDLATFSEEIGQLSFRVLPTIQNGQTDWRIVVYMQGTQGPVYQSRDGLTDGAAAQFGVTEDFQERINSALAYAEAEFEVPAELGDQKRAKRSLSDLEARMENNDA